MCRPRQWDPDTCASRRRIRGKFTGRELSSNPARGWIYTRGARGGKSRRQRARGIAIGGHSSIHGINTLELMKAPREQQASGRNVNRDRPASDPFSCTANSQGPHLPSSPPPQPTTLPLAHWNPLLTPCLASSTLLRHPQQYHASVCADSFFAPFFPLLYFFAKRISRDLNLIDLGNEPVAPSEWSHAFANVS